MDQQLHQAKLIIQRAQKNNKLLVEYPQWERLPYEVKEQAIRELELNYLLTDPVVDKIEGNTIVINQSKLELTEDGRLTDRQSEILRRMNSYKEDGSIDFTKPHTSIGSSRRAIWDLKKFFKAHPDVRPEDLW